MVVNGVKAPAATDAAGGGREPWHVRVENELRERPGVLLISLLTDEAGAAWIAGGRVPEYLRRQALDALAWSNTLERMAVELDPPRENTMRQLSTVRWDDRAEFYITITAAEVRTLLEDAGLSAELRTQFARLLEHEADAPPADTQGALRLTIDPDERG